MLRLFLKKIFTVFCKQTAAEKVTTVDVGPNRITVLPTPKPLELPIQAVTLGLDFGTSATKCIINLENYEKHNDKYIIYAFPNNSTSFTLCCPTAIGINGDSFVFGTEADLLSEDKVIRSVKMAIPCIRTGWGNFRSPFMLENKPGKFKIAGTTFSAVDLAALYLAFVIRQIKQDIKSLLRDAYRLQVYINMAAPMDQLVRPDVQEISPRQERDAELAKLYQNLGQWSLKLSSYSQNPWRIKDAIEALKCVNQIQLKPVKQSPVYVVPETLAAITAYITKPSTLPGKYMTVDVGAGTTDISVFWLQKMNYEIKPWYYASRSYYVGMDDIDRALESLLTENVEGNSLRSRRELFEKTNDGLWFHRSMFQPVLDGLYSNIKSTFGEAYKKESKITTWGDKRVANLTALMLGGGCRTDVVRKILERNLWDNCLGPPQSCQLTLSVSDAILFNGKIAEKLDKQILSNQATLMVIAEGLAHKSIDIPEYGIAKKTLFERPKIEWDIYQQDHWW